jgi:small subunit ribosomal protein S8
MSVTDPIADALTIIRNANRTGKETAEVKASKAIGEIFDILKRERFIEDSRFMDDKKQGFYKVYLKFQKGKIPAISGIKKISTSGRRVYVQAGEVPRVFNGLGIAIVSTSKGMMTDSQAREQGVGGEVICEVW